MAAIKHRSDVAKDYEVAETAIDVFRQIFYLGDFEYTPLPREATRTEKMQFLPLLVKSMCEGDKVTLKTLDGFMSVGYVNPFYKQGIELSAVEIAIQFGRHDILHVFRTFGYTLKAWPVNHERPLKLAMKVADKFPETLDYCLEEGCLFRDPITLAVKAEYPNVSTQQWVKIVFVENAFALAKEGDQDALQDLLARFAAHDARSASFYQNAWIELLQPVVQESVGVFMRRTKDVLMKEEVGVMA